MFENKLNFGSYHSFLFSWNRVVKCTLTFAHFCRANPKWNKNIIHYLNIMGAGTIWSDEKFKNNCRFATI